MTKRTSGLLIPMPNAMVATINCRRPAVTCLSDASGVCLTAELVHNNADGSVRIVPVE